MLRHIVSLFVRDRRRAFVASAAALSAVAVAVSFGPVVRAASRSWGERHGLSVDIERVRPSWGGVRLGGVRMRAPELADADVHVDEIDVKLGFTLAPRRIDVRGSSVVLRGAARDLLAKLRDRQKSSPSTGTNNGRNVELRVEGLGVHWDGALGGADTTLIRGMSLVWGSSADRIEVESVEESRGAASAILRRMVARFERREDGPKIVEASIGALDLKLAAGKAPEAAPSTPGASAIGSGALDAPSAFALLRAAGAGYRRAANASARLVDRLADAGTVAIGEVRAVVERGGSGERGETSLNVGPGSFRAHRDGEDLVFEGHAGKGPFAGAASANGTGAASEAGSELSVRGHIGKGREPLLLEIEGGPVTLAALGIHENDFGLLAVDHAVLDARATVRVTRDRTSLEVDGSGHLADLSIDDPRLADEAVRGLDLGWRAKGSALLDGSQLTLEEGELNVGKTHLQARGTVRLAAGSPSGTSQGRGMRVDGDVGVVPVDCQTMLDSIPRGLIRRLEGMRMGGVFAMDGHVAIDTQAADPVDIDWNLRNRCRVVSPPRDADVSRFAGEFHRVVYDADGQKVDMTTGPGTPDWVPLAQMSPYLAAAVTTTEDGGFFHHGGFDKAAIRNSIRDDIKAGKFLRGASTISMQLAKNLYLEREKSLSRKLQEAFLTMYLEQELSKSEILELYFNVVELGPMIYGVGPAADHYFRTTAAELTLGQALFLSSILPSPKRQYFAADGRLSKGWAAYLRRVMQIMYERERIDEHELSEGLREVLVFGQPKPEREDLAGTDAGGDTRDAAGDLKPRRDARRGDAVAVPSGP